MTFWTWLRGSLAGETPNANPASSVGPPGYSPGDPNGLEWDPPPPVVNNRFAQLSPSPWSGWPAEWSTPDWQQKAAPLVDTAWACLDLNSSILSAMPTFRLQKGQIKDPLPWMQNPDGNNPEGSIYVSWPEFAKQVFWDYQMGEAFIYATARDFNDRVSQFRYIPPYLIKPEVVGYDRRRYWFGDTELERRDVLHIRYKSDPTLARGCGPLDSGGPRAVAAGLIVKLVSQIAEQGGLPPYFLTTDLRLTREQANDQLDEWVDSRIRNAGRPALLSGGVKPATLTMSVKEMSLLELGQWTESRIAILLGVPPFLVGLPSGGDSLTYTNVSQLFDFHDRSSLRTKATAVMSALSGWALPRGQSIELDSENYTRPGMLERSQAYVNLASVGAIDGQEVRMLEKLHGDAPAPAATMEGGDGA